MFLAAIPPPAFCTCLLGPGVEFSDLPNSMLKATDIFQKLPAPTVDGILTHLQGADKPTYRVAIQTLAAARKLRPVFVERKPRPERHAWMQSALARPQNEQISANLLQMWLMGSQSPMLCDFLDSLGIAHDEQGGIENLPPCPEPEKLRASVDALLAKYPADAVAVYLHSFQAMDIAGWPPLAEILATDERLQLGSTPAPVAS